MRSSKTEAIVIKRRDFGEKDRILTLFTREDGKLDAISKGARRPGSRFSYFSDIGSVGQFYIYQSKSIPIITDYKPIFAPEAAREDFNKTEKLSFAFRLIDKLYHEADPHPKTYDILKHTTKEISGSHYQMMFLIFLLNVIDDLGMRPKLDSCTFCQKPVTSEKEISFALDSGVCHSGCAQEGVREISANELKLLRFIYKKPYNEISRARVSPEIFDRAYLLIAEYFNWHFGKILPEKVL